MPDAGWHGRLSRSAAWLLVAVAVLAVVGDLVAVYPRWITGVIGWFACVLFWPRLSLRQKTITLLLLAFGGAGMVWGGMSGRSGLVTLALTQNIPLLGMLIGVSFLQLISTQRGDSGTPLSTGRRALFNTLVGVHLFGAVINYSAVAIFADRLAAKARLSLDQATGLSQSFILGSVWSPFYGAMAVALTFAPGASLLRVVSVGIPLAVAGVLLSWLTLSSARHGHAREFAGYPLRLDALRVPFALAVAVLVAHELKPAWSVLAVITLIAPLVTVVTLLARDGSRTGEALLRSVHLRLPEMRGEMALFLAAGVLSAGMTGVIAALDLALPFREFGALEAGLTVAAIVIAAWIGFHPLIFCSVIGPWIAPITSDPNLLALTCLFAWGIGLPGCPMSNTVLALHARYGTPVAELLKRNRIFGFELLLVAAALFAIYAVIEK